MLFFLDAQGQRLWSARWTGPWPPSERMTVAVGRQTGGVSICEDESLKPEVLEEIRASGTIDLLSFRLRNASTMPEAAPEGAHWFRGAEYVPVTDD